MPGPNKLTKRPLLPGDGRFFVGAGCWTEPERLLNGVAVDYFPWPVEQTKSPSWLINQNRVHWGRS